MRIPNSPFPSCLPTPGCGGSPFSTQDLRSTQAGQLEQINQGLASGLISQREATGLLGQQGAISKAIDLASADGFVDPFERMGIKSMQAQAGGNIFQSSFNGEMGNPLMDLGFSARQGSQLSQIAQGIASGSVTGGEAAGLLGQQAGIAGQAAAAQFGGINPLESAGLNARQTLAQWGINSAQLNWNFDF